MTAVGPDVGSSEVVGRQRQLGRLRTLIDRAPVQGQVLVLLGEAGIGKSTLLASAAQEARAAGMRVLWATGRESETNIAFAGLHRLLSPVLGAAADLERRQARALLGALGLAGEPAAADLLGTGLATLTLLSDSSAPAPVLVIVDDAHWLDRSTLDILAFAGSRLETERVVLLLAARGHAPPAGFDRGFTELPVEALSAADAGLLLDRQPRPPHGRARTQVLAQAAGNPMALIELAKVIAGDPAASRRWAAEPLPPGDRLLAVITARLTALPEPTRAALLVAAVADGPDLRTPGAGGPDPQTLAPAERLGLVTMDRTGLRFSHPLVRSAIYHGAPFAQRAAAHRQLAAALQDQPDRQAWHLAAATLQPDEELASRLETTADQARRRGGVTAAAAAMERAAELSPDPSDQARRLVSAAATAVSTGQAAWVADLATRALAVTADPELRLLARSSAGWALAYSGRRSAALPALISVAEEAAGDFPALAWEALADAATVAYQSGAATGRAAVDRLLTRMGPSGDAGPQKAWILACTDPFGSRGELVAYLRQTAGSPLAESAKWRIGSAAWLLDESGLGMQLLQDAMYQLRAPGTQGTSGGGLTALGWLYVDTGRWDQALEAAAEAADWAEANQMGIVAATADVIAATVLALRADGRAARTHADRALAGVDPAENGLIAVRGWRALGIAALAEGDHLLAFTLLRRLFSEDGAPVHNIFSYLGVADLATAAVRADRRREGRIIVERALGHPGERALGHPVGTLSPRLEQLVARARGILADPASAGAHFAGALRDPAGEQWPFERAQLRLDYAEWLRRRRRINEAKPELANALETFRRLGARSLAQRTEAELRASGVVVTGAAGVADALMELTPQQRQIVRLARDGLTNREIGDRLSLSPRTVGSHLYRSFPKLGITDRHQLRDVPGQETPP